MSKEKNNYRKFGLTSFAVDNGVSILVLVGICTHLGCSPSFVPEALPQPYDAEWKGGFFCPCHGSTFDIAGRVYAGVPAPTNLPVPPHRYLSETEILIGEDEGAA